MALGIPSSPASLFDDLGDGVVLRVEPKALWELVTALPLSYTLVLADLFIVDSCFVDLGEELIFRKWLTLGILCAEVENWFLRRVFSFATNCLVALPD